MGKGCPICGRTKNKGRIPQKTNEFIDKAKKIHGDKYDYSKVDLKKKDEKGRICIICPKHGEFWQTPENHLQGKGCNKCSPNSMVTTKEWIQRAQKVHGNQYDYSKVHYVNIHTKVCIVCPIHGEFEQFPGNHLRGYGCPFCHKSKLEREVEKLLIENKIEYIAEYSPLWLGRQELDFYLPKHNIAIECQGIQHFQPVARFGGESAFHHAIELDDRKYRLCQENKVELIYFSHVHKDYRHPIISTGQELLQKICLVNKN